MINFDSAIAFDSMKFRGGGVELSKCSCTGSSSYYVPRGHIDFISSSHKFYFKTFFVGLVLLAVGIYAMVTANFSIQSLNDRKWTWLLPGLIVMFIALIAMIPNTLTIASNSATFVSTNCSNEKDLQLLKEWMSDAATPLIAASAQFAPSQPVVFASPPLSPTSMGQSPDVSKLMDSRQASPRAAADFRSQAIEGARSLPSANVTVPLTPRIVGMEMTTPPNQNQVVPNQPSVEINSTAAVSPRRASITASNNGRVTGLGLNQPATPVDVIQPAAAYASAPVTYRMLPTTSQPSAPLDQPTTLGRTPSVLRIVRSESPSIASPPTPTSARGFGAAGATASAWASPVPQQTTESAYRSMYGQL